MPDENQSIVYRLKVLDDGASKTFVITAEAGKQMGAEVSAAADQATASLNQMGAAAAKAGASTTKLSASAQIMKDNTAAGFKITAQQAEQAAWWMSAMGQKQFELQKQSLAEAAARKKGTEEVRKQEVAVSSLNRTMERIQRTVAAFVGVWAFQKVVSGLSGMVKGGIEFNAVMEESRLGMAAIFMAQGQFVTSSGRALEGMSALNSAMEMSTKISKELQLDNLKTAATYQQLVKAYQQTIAPGLAVGFNPEQIREYTVAMVQAASALGLNLDMLAEETRSMLRGAITPRNTLIATALGIRNEDIQRYKGDVEGLYKFVMGRLSAFGVAGEAVQMTWKGAISNVKDVIQMVLGEGFTNLFDYLKSQALSLQKILVKWTVKGPELDKEVVAGFSAMGQAIIEMVEGTKTWLKSLSGLLPILGVIYQILRFIGLVLTPIVELLGVIVDAVGEWAKVLTVVYKGINDIATASKTFQTVLSSIVIFLAYTAAVGASLSSFATGTSSVLARMAGSVAGLVNWMAPLAAMVLLFIQVRDAMSVTATTWQSLGSLLKAGLTAAGVLLLSTFIPGLTAAVAGMAAFLIPIAAAVVLFNDLTSGVKPASIAVEVLRAAFVLLGATILYTTGPIGMVLAGLMALAEAWNLLKKSGFGQSWGTDVGIEGMALSGSPTAPENATNGALSEQATFKQRIVELDQKQTDELLKITQLTGEISEQDRKRMTDLNNITKLYKDSYGEIQKQVDLYSSGEFKLPEFEGVGSSFIDEFTAKGLTGVEQVGDAMLADKARAEELGNAINKAFSDVPKYAVDMADLSLEMQLAIAAISNEWRKMGLSAKEIENRIGKIIEKVTEKIQLRIDMDIANVDLQIASQNKNYERQRQLIDDIASINIQRMRNENKWTIESESAERRKARQQKIDVSNIQEQEQLGWKIQQASADAYWGEIQGNIQAQLEAEAAVFAVKQAQARIGIELRTQEDQLAILAAQKAEKDVFDNQQQRKDALFRLDLESKILDAKKALGSAMGNYRLEASLTKEIAENHVMAMIAAGKIPPEHEEEAKSLTRVLAALQSRKELIEGEYNLNKDIMDVNAQIADSVGNSSDVYQAQLDIVEATKQKSIDMYDAILDANQELIANGADESQIISDEQLEKMRLFIDLMEKLGLIKAKNSQITKMKEEVDFWKSAAEGIGEYSSVADTWYQKEMNYIEEIRKLNAKRYGEEIANLQAAQERNNLRGERFDIENKNINAVISNTEKMFDKASTLYAKDSKQYKALQEMKKVAMLAEIAQEIRKNALLLIGMMIENTKAKEKAALVAADILYGDAIIAQNEATAVSGAAASVAAQGQVPFAGFAMAAAMIALMASVLAGAGIAFGGGGGGSSAPALPPSTVLGAAPGTASESTTKIYDLLQETYGMQLNQLTTLNRSVVGLTNGIRGLINAWFISGGEVKVGQNFQGGFEAGGLGNFLADNTIGFWTGLTKVMTFGLLDSLPGAEWLNKAINKVFGGGTTKSLEQAGILFKDISVAALQAGEDIQAMGYSLIKVTKEGGWFRKDKTHYEKQLQELDSQTDLMLNSIFQNMSDILIEVTKQLGGDVDAAMKYVFEGADLDLKGLDAEEATKKLNEYFSELGDKAITTLLGSMIKEYQKVGEGLLETAVRLVQDMAVVDEVLKITNQQFSAATTTSIQSRQVITKEWEEWNSLQGTWLKRFAGPEPIKYMTEFFTVTETAKEKMIAFTEKIIEMAGGLEKLTESVQNYYDKFFSDSEKAAYTASNLAEAFANFNAEHVAKEVPAPTTGTNIGGGLIGEIAGNVIDTVRDVMIREIEEWNLDNVLNLQLPATREGFRDLVESLDLTTTSGMEAYIMLMNLADSADMVYKAQEKLAEDWDDLMTKLTELQIEGATTLKDMAKAALDKAFYNLSNIQVRLDMGLEVDSGGLEAATAAVAKAQEEYAEALQQSIAMQENLDAAIAVGRQRELEAMDVALRPLQQAVWAQEDYNNSIAELADAQKDYDTAVRNTETAMNNLTSAINRLEKAEQNVIDTDQKIIDAKDAYEQALIDGPKRIEEANRRYTDSLKAIVRAERAYVDAQKALADEIRAQEIAVIEARLDAEAAARKAEIENLEKQQDYWDEQYDLYKDQLDAQKDFVDKLSSVSKTVKDWVGQMSTSSELAPVLSRNAFEAEYQRLKTLATAPGAEESAVSDFTSYAEQYLEFQRQYGGDYLTTFDQVMSDVAGIGDQADQQLVIAQAQLDSLQTLTDQAKAESDRLIDEIKALKEADEIANDAARALLDSLKNTAEDAAQRIADLQERIDEAAQGIIDAQDKANEAFLGIAEAEKESARKIEDAFRAIGEAEKAHAAAEQEVIDATNALVDAQTNLLIAQATEQAALDRLVTAQEAETAAMISLTEAMNALAASYAPIGATQTGGLPTAPTTPIDYGGGGLIDNTPTPIAPPVEATIISPSTETYYPPTNIEPPPILTSPFNWTGAVPYGYTGTEPVNQIGSEVGGYSPPVLPSSELPSLSNWLGTFTPNYAAVGGLYDTPTIGAEAGPEWFVPTYEPERSNFLKRAPQSFWDNLESGNGDKGNGENGGGVSDIAQEMVLHIHTNLDGREIAESVAKYIPKNGALASEITKIAKRVR